MIALRKPADAVEWLARKLCALESEYHDPDMLVLCRDLPTIRTPRGLLPIVSTEYVTGGYYAEPLWTLYVEQAERLIKAGLINFNE